MNKQSGSIDGSIVKAFIIRTQPSRTRYRVAYLLKALVPCALCLLLLFVRAGDLWADPYIGSGDPIVTQLTTDEDTDITITLTEGHDTAPGILTYKIVSLTIPYGNLCQYDGGHTKIETTPTDVTDPNRRVIYKPENRNESYEVSFVSKVYNGGVGSTNQETVTIAVDADNDRPVITSIPAETGQVGLEYRYDFVSSDEDVNDVLKITAESKPSWLDLTDNGDGTGKLAGTPAADDSGPNYVKLRVTDSLGLFAEQAFTIMVPAVEVLEINALDDLNNQITKNTTWNYEKVIIKAGAGNKEKAITIRPGVTLTINPGVVVEFYDGFGLNVTGGLSAVGTAAKTITFKGKDWGGIAFTNSNKASALAYCKLEKVKGKPPEWAGAISLINSSQVVIDHCTISSNEAVFGGGIYLKYSNATITNNTISDNNDCQSGGGIYCVGSNPTLELNTIINNKDCTRGGGIYLKDSNPALTGNIITNNSAQSGGGMYCTVSNPRMVNTIIANNSGTVKGGGIYCENSSPSLINNTVSRNLSPQGAGIFCESSSSPNLRNTILYGNNLTGDDGSDTGEFEEVYLEDADSDPVFSYCVIQGGSAAFNGSGAGGYYGGAYEQNIDSDPLFTSPSQEAGLEGSGVWSLSAESPCINAGDPGLAGTPSMDIEGNPRPYNDVRVDIGAYEFQNNPPSISPDECEASPTDEDTSITISLGELATASDADGDMIHYKIVAPPSYGKLFQYEDGEKGMEISFSEQDTYFTVTDPDARVIYEPGNRSSDYTDTFSFKVRDERGQEAADDLLEMDSRNAAQVSISVRADNEMPAFTSDIVEQVNPTEEYRYEITVEDDDADHPGTSLNITAVLLPSWLTLTDNGDGTAILVGTPSIADVGEHNVTILLTDGGNGYAEQSFTITVGPKAGFSVDAGPDISSEPRADIFFKATCSEEGISLVYRWVITDEEGTQLEEVPGASFRWTPSEEGLYTAEVTVSNDKGSDLGSDKVELIIAVGFTNINDGNRQDPTFEQEQFIEGLGASREMRSRASSTHTIDKIAEVSRLNLDQDQRGKVLAGILDVLHTVDLADTPTNKLLGALDNLIIEHDASDEEKLTNTQVRRLVVCLDEMADAVAMSKLQVPKAIEVVNELIGQQGSDSFSFDAASYLRVTVEKIVREGTALRSSVNASSRDHVKLTIRVVGLASMTGPVQIGGEAEGDPKITVPYAAASELMAKLGLDEVTVTLLATTVSGVIDGVLVSIELTGYESEELHVRNLDTPFEIALPVTEPSMVTPMYHDASAGIWRREGISNVKVIDERMVAFKVNHLTYFSLLPESGPPRAEGSTVDEVMKDAAGCFIETAASGSTTAPRVELPSTVWISWRTLKLVPLSCLCFMSVLMALVAAATGALSRKLRSTLNSFGHRMDLPGRKP